jgi:hypothetical protein
LSALGTKLTELKVRFERGAGIVFENISDAEAVKEKRLPRESIA